MDPGNPVIENQPPPPAPAPSPAPAPAPTSAVPPPAPHQPSPEAPALDLERWVEVPGPDGRPVVERVGVLLQRAAQMPTDLRAEDINKLRIIQDAVDGKPGAWERMQSLAASQPPQPGQPPAATSGALDPAVQAEINTMKQQLASVLPVANKIREVQDNAIVDGFVEQSKEQLPFLAKAPDRIELVRRFSNEVNNELRGRGINTGVLNRNEQLQCLADAMTRANNYVQQYAQVFGSPPPAAPAAKPAGALNDQPRVDPNAPIYGARYRVVNGQLIDAAGNMVVQDPSRSMHTLPTQIPEAPVGGAPVPAGALQSAPKKWGVGDLVNSLRGRIQNMGQ